MKLAILPSESQVMSCIVASLVGFSSSLDIGIMGNIWSIAQESVSDWNSEKLQKYLSGIILVMVFISSGGCFIDAAISAASLAIDQNSFSIMALDRMSNSPRLKRSSASSRICSASCQLSKRVWLFRLSQMS